MTRELESLLEQSRTAAREMGRRLANLSPEGLDPKAAQELAALMAPAGELQAKAVELPGGAEWLAEVLPSVVEAWRAGVAEVRPDWGEAPPEAWLESLLPETP